MPDEMLTQELNSGGLVPDHTGPEIWDCTDERPLVPFLELRRQFQFGTMSTFAIAGGREGFAVADLVARAALEGQQSLNRLERFLQQRSEGSPFIHHSVSFAHSAQYGRGALDPTIESEFNRHYEFFRTMKDLTIHKDVLQQKGAAVLELMKTYDAAILNTHSDKNHEKNALKIKHSTLAEIGCAHNKLVGKIAEKAANPELLPVAEKVGNLMGFTTLPFDVAARGLSIVGQAFNRQGQLSVKRTNIVAEGAKRNKPADIILDGSHLPSGMTSMVVDGGRTARDVNAQNNRNQNKFMSNPVLFAERLKKISEYGEETELIIAIMLLHMLAVRDELCGNEPKDDPTILPIHVTPFRLQAA